YVVPIVHQQDRAEIGRGVAIGLRRPACDEGMPSLGRNQVDKAAGCACIAKLRDRQELSGLRRFGFGAGAADHRCSRNRSGSLQNPTACGTANTDAHGLTLMVWRSCSTFGAASRQAAEVGEKLVHLAI